ncbi:hypothetical protein [Aeromicrobium sp.]|uniref:hypothetical protein n=1 Tax=Aeromicrobium sp. TaxID=1871063 RepID=UPI003D6A45A3
MTSSAFRTLVLLMAVAFVVSVVHYVDNTVNYGDFPQPEPGSGVPNPPRWLVGAAWFFFTAFGVLGLWWLAHGRTAWAAVAIAAYSGSGLVGFAHYAVPGATDMVWWRQAHVIADIICGVLLFGFALWLALRFRPSPASPGTAR